MELESAIASFFACLRFAARDKYDASNSDLATLLNDFAIDHGINPHPNFSAQYLKILGIPGKAKSTQTEAWVIRTGISFFYQRQLIPDNLKGWSGLEFVHKQVFGSADLPAYLQEAKKRSVAA